jgi:predicted kinase
MPLPAVHRDIEQVLRARLVDLVRAGSDVVLDFSFWSRNIRDECRELLRRFGVVPETVYLATDRATVLQRVGARGSAGRRRPRDQHGTRGLLLRSLRGPYSGGGPLTVMS